MAASKFPLSTQIGRPNRRVIVENGKLLGQASDGQLIGRRKTPPEVLRGPAC